LADTTVVEIRLETGRRNQIRVHFADHGHPVLGDPRYNHKLARHERWPKTRLALHATLLGFTHPATLQAMQFHADLPNLMTRFIGK
jgi:23S rRNA pseudouridine1911/1915/1917 synthase